MSEKHITVRIERHRDIGELGSRELIAIIADAKHQDRAEAAEEWDTRARGLPAVVLAPSGAVDEDESVEALRYARRRTRLEFWGPHHLDVKTAKSVCGPVDMYDPLTGDLLVRGVNQRTLADWSGVPLDRLELVSFAYRRGMLEGRAPSELADELRGETLSTFWTRVEKLKKGSPAPSSRGRHLGREALLRERAGSGPVPSDPRSLEQVLVNYFNVDELRRIAERLGVAGHLPGPGASLRTLAFEFRMTAMRHGVLDDLRREVADERPGMFAR